MRDQPVKSRSGRFGWVVAALVLAAAGASAVGFEFAPADGGGIAGFRAVPLDDSWIHYVYAESLGTSLRLDYNPGESEAGFTSLLWVILLAPPLALGIDAPLASKVLGLAAHVAVAMLLYAGLRRVAPRALAIGAALLLAAEPIFAYAAMSGMEVMLYTALMAAAALLFLGGRYRSCAVALALGVLARPDGMVLVVFTWAAAGAQLAVTRFRDPELGWRQLAWLVGLPVAAGVAWSLYCLVATGLVFPTSYYVRAGGVGFLSNLRYLGRILHEISYTLFPLSHWPKALLLLPGAAFAVRRFGARAVLPVLFPPAFALSMGGEVIGVMGGSFTGNRYLVPVFPFLLALQVMGIALLADGVRRLLPGRAAGERLVPAAAVVLLLLLALPYGQWVGRLRDQQATYAQSCANIEQMQVAIGRWVARSTPPDAVIAVHDAGAIRYLGERRTLDFLGLNTTDLPAEDLATIEQTADYLITFPSWTPHLVEPFADREVLRVVLDRNVVCADDTMVVYAVAP